MAALEQDIVLEYGADWGARVTVADATTKEPVDMTGGEAELNVARTGSLHLTQAGLGTSTITFGDGFVDILLAREDFEDLLNPGTGEWELFVKAPAGRWIKWFAGQARVEGKLA